MSEDISGFEKTNLQMQLVHRSLYILKRKFEIHKEQINQIYYEHKQKEIKNPLLTFSLKQFPEVLNNIMSIANLLILPFRQYSELITADLMTQLNYEKTQNIIQQLTQYIKENIYKYNLIFYEKKMKEIKIREKLAENNAEFKEEILDKEIILYNKRGVIIRNKEQVLENNIELDLEKEPYIIYEDDIQILNSDKFIYSQTLPLIIADFVQIKINVGIVSTNDELSTEIRNLFDSNIVKLISKLENIDPLEEIKRDIKNLLFEEMNLDQQLRTYENLLIEKKRTQESTKVVMDMINKLKFQKASLHQKINYLKKEAMISFAINESEFDNMNNIENENNMFKYKMENKIVIKKKKLTKEEKRINSLKEIFYFYSQQHKMIGKSATFDSYLTNKESMDVGEFKKFCEDFFGLNKKNKNNLYNLDLYVGQLVYILKRDKNKEKLNFNEFVSCLNELSLKINEDEISTNESKKDDYMNMLKQIEQEENKKKLSENNGEENEQNLNEEKKEENEENKEENEEKKEENEENKEENEENKKENEENKKENEEKKEINNKEKKKINRDKKIIKKEKKTLPLLPKNELIDKINELDNKIEKLKNKSNETKLEDLYKIMGLDDYEYKKKMNGFISPFDIRYKSRIERNDNYNMKKDSEEISEIQKIIRRNKAEMENDEKLNERIQRKNQYKDKVKKFNEDNKHLKKSLKNQTKEKKYMQILKSQQDYKKEHEDKITWEELNKYDYDHFILNDQEIKPQVNTLRKSDNHIYSIFNNETIEDEDIGIFPNYKNRMMKSKVLNKSKLLNIDNNFNGNFSGSNIYMSDYNNNLNGNYSGSNIYKSGYNNINNNNLNGNYSGSNIYKSGYNNINNNNINKPQKAQVYVKNINNNNNKRYENNVLKTAGNDIITSKNMMKEGMKKKENLQRKYEKSQEKIKKKRIEDEVNLIKKIEKRRSPGK